MTREQKEQINRINELTLNLCNDAYNKGFEAGTESIQECSWEKGVRDAWEYIRREVDELYDDNSISWTQSIESVQKFLHNLDPVIYTKDYVEKRNKEDLAKTEPIEVGDIVTRPDGEERLAIQVVGDFIYTFDHQQGADLTVCARNELKKTGKKAILKVFKPLAVGELK